MRGRSLALCVVLGLNGWMGCATGRQAARTKVVAERVAAGALITMLAAAAIGATFPDASDEAYGVGLAMVPVSLVAVGVYIGADSIPGSEGEGRARSIPPDLTNQRRNQLARELARAGADAARAGDCDRVRELLAKVGELDTAVQSTMLRYRRIADCIAVPSPQ